MCRKYWYNLICLKKIFILWPNPFTNSYSLWRACTWRWWSRPSSPPCTPPSGSTCWGTYQRQAALYTCRDIWQFCGSWSWYRKPKRLIKRFFNIGVTYLILAVCYSLQNILVVRGFFFFASNWNFRHLQTRWSRVKHIPDAKYIIFA